MRFLTSGLARKGDNMTDLITAPVRVSSDLGARWINDKASIMPAARTGASAIAGKPVAGGRRGRCRMSAPDPFASGGTPDNDAVLLAAEREWLEWLSRADAQLKIDAADGFMEPLWHEIGKRAETICNTPPSTLIGAAVKLRMALHPELGIEEDQSSEIVIALRQVLALIEREIGQAGPRSAQGAATGRKV
jgi:hypothetical protein